MSTQATARRGNPLRAVARIIPAGQRRVAVTIALALAGDQLLDPNSNHVPLCPLHAMTGLWCPFCGGLRSAYELTRLHFGAALRDNLIVVIAVPIVAIVWLEAVLRRRADTPPRRWPRAATVAIVLALIAFTVIRNLPAGAVLRGG